MPALRTLMVRSLWRETVAKPVKKAEVIPTFEPVVVTWEDAMAAGSEQHDSIPAAMRNYKPCIRKSIGLYIGIAEKDGRRALLIGTDDDRNDENPESIGGISQIPIGMVISCVPVRARRAK